MDDTVIGGYQLGKCLGTGATATVHLGTRQTDGVQVAIKLLHPELVDNPELVERFRREARTLRRLEHQNIVGFIDFVEEPPHYVFVMELLDGGTLETYLNAKGKVREDRVLVWTRQLAVALAVAHEQNVVHRDVKPANVFLTTAGRVVLSDFGLARPEDDKVTRAGAKMMGTPLYMAPEQILGRTATPATDVYQVGLLLYEMLLGERAFPRDDAYSRMMARLDEDLFIPMDVEVSPALREIVRRCGMRDPQRRYPDGRTLLADVEAARENRHLPWTPPQPNQKRQATLTTQGLDWKDPKYYQGILLVCPQVNLRFDPQGKPVVIGSDPTVNVCLESRDVPIAPRQMRIAPIPGGWQIETGNFQAEVRVRGQALHGGSRRLDNGDIIEIGGYELLWVDHVSDAGGEAPPGAAAAPEAPPRLPRPTGPHPVAASRVPQGTPPARPGCLGALVALLLPLLGGFAVALAVAVAG